MATLVKTGIGDGQTLTPVMITELYDALTGDKLYDNLIINNSLKRLKKSTDIYEFGKTLNQRFTYQDKIDFI